jgi:hypothetical protein
MQICRSGLAHINQHLYISGREALASRLGLTFGLVRSKRISAFQMRTFFMLGSTHATQVGRSVVRVWRAA